MNFYLFENDSRHTTTIRDLIEADFNNNLVGIGVSLLTYDDLLQLRVDIMIISSNDPKSSSTNQTARTSSNQTALHYD